MRHQDPMPSRENENANAASCVATGEALVGAGGEVQNLCPSAPISETTAERIHVVEVAAIRHEELVTKRFEAELDMRAARAKERQSWPGRLVQLGADDAVSPEMIARLHAERDAAGVNLPGPSASSFEVLPPEVQS